MSKLAKLVGNSRLASVPKPLVPFNATDAHFFPTHQVIQTTTASQKLQDFGLKSKIPEKIAKQTRYLIVEELDTMEHMTKFEPKTFFYRTKARFQELGVPVTKMTSALRKEQSPLFPSKNSSEKDTNSVAALMGLSEESSEREIEAAKKELAKLRPEFNKWLVAKCPEKVNSAKYNKDNLALELVQFLQEKRGNKLNKNWVHMESELKGTGGLSYLQKGRLKNDVHHGFQNDKVVPGRIVSDQNTYATCGFVTKLPLASSHQATIAKASNDKHYKEVMIPTAVHDAVLKSNGSVTLKMKGIQKLSAGFSGDRDFLMSKLGDSERNDIPSLSATEISRILN